MPKIFISYRRTDTGPEAGRLRTALVHHFGKQHIFRDKESIRPGVNWREEVVKALSGDTVVLALIGKTWITALDPSGHRLIDSTASTNRLELETALRARLRTIPVLVEGAELPRESDLPDSLRELLTINALKLRDDDWDSDCDKLIQTLESIGVLPSAGYARGERTWLAGSMPWLALVALVAVAAFAVIVVMPWFRQPSVTPEPTRPPTSVSSDGPNFQIVVDRSEAMNASFGTGTKLDETKKALVSVLQEKTADTDNLSLREFGGDCSDLNPTRLVLPFAPGERRLAQGLDSLTTTRGTSTLVNAIIEATGDFRGRQGSSGIIVISGSYDACKHPNPEALIQERLKRYQGLTIDWRFIGVALTPREQSMARELARKTGGTFRNATSPAQLTEAVEHAIVVRTKVGEVKTAVDIINESLTHLNTAIANHLGSSLDYNAANREVGAAEDALNRSVVPPADSQHPDGVRELLNLARQARDDQQKMLDATKALIAAKQANDATAEARARSAYNQLVSAYNPRKDKINELQGRLLNGN